MNTIYIKRFAALLPAVFSLILTLVSCEERININTETSAPHLVIYGYLSNEESVHNIKITRSTGYFVNVKPDGISNAVVTIREEGGETFTLTEVPSEPGLYVTERMAGIPGRTYTLNVLLDFDDDGRQEEYEATSLLPYPATVDSIDFQPSEFFNDFVEILLWGRMPEGDENHLTLQLLVNSYRGDNSFEDYVLLDEEYIGQKEMEAVPCYYHDLEDLELNDGDTLTLQADAVTKEYYTFVESAQDELRGGNPIFSGPPANVKTNIKSKDPSNQTPISGFFTALSRDNASVVYKK